MADPGTPRDGVASAPYAAARAIDSLDACSFYHTTELPGHGVVAGAFDLRGREDAYLGNVPLAGRRVLEIGTASGHLCFYMERAGAEVVAYDLSPELPWELVPDAPRREPAFADARAAEIRRLNAAWWFCHRAHASRARLVHGQANQLPCAIGEFDVVTLGCVLLHLRDPMGALEQVASRSRDTVVVTELAPSRATQLAGAVLPTGLVGAGYRLAERLGPPRMRLLPEARRRAPLETWWGIEPGVVRRMLAVLGFSRSAVTWHRQRFQGRPILLHTVVARR